MALDLEGLRNKKARRSINGWSPKPGENIILILPHTTLYFNPDAKVADFAHEFKSHFLKAEGMDTTVIRCLRDRKESCPFCDLTRRLRDSSDPALQKMADDTKSSERHLMNILVMSDPSSGIQVYETGPKVYGDILDFAANPAWGDLFHPQHGRNVSLLMTPGNQTKSKWNEYKVQPHPNPTDVMVHLPSDWLELIDNLEQSIPGYPDQELINRWIGLFNQRTGTPAPAPISTQPFPTPAPWAPPVNTTVGVVPSSPTTAPSYPAALPTYPTATASATVPVQDSPTAVWAASHGLTTKLGPGGKAELNVVPQCFSEGVGKPGFGFNPAVFPCEKGCVVRNDCQLKQLGLA